MEHLHPEFGRVTFIIWKNSMIKKFLIITSVIKETMTTVTWYPGKQKKKKKFVRCILILIAECTFKILLSDHLAINASIANHIEIVILL